MNSYDFEKYIKSIENKIYKDAAAAVKEENTATKTALNEARAAYIEATYDYYKALGISVEKEELEETINLIEGLTKIKDTFINIIKQEPKEETNNDYTTILNFIKNI